MISSCTDLLPATVVYDELGPIMTTLNAGALLLSLSLYVKGLVAPSTSDSGTTGSLMMDLYWGERSRSLSALSHCLITSAFYCSLCNCLFV